MDSVFCSGCGCSSLPPVRQNGSAPALCREQSYQSCLKDTISSAFPPLSAAPPQPPAEDVDRYRRRFNMRMLVPGRPVKETPATPPPVPTERPAYREKFIPPELSMWDYFVAKVSNAILEMSKIDDRDP